MDAQEANARSSRLAILALVVALIALVVAAIAFIGDDDDEEDAPSTSTTLPAGTSTTTPSSTTAPAADLSGAVFPDATTSRRFDDPLAATRAFATELLGFNAPLVGEFAAGDSRSGEVEVRGFEGGRPTTVLVRQLENDTWFVLGAIAESIRLDVPTARDRMASPSDLRGAASAFEGHVVVHLFADGVAEPIGVSYVTGRGDGELGDFEGSISFDVPDGVTDGVLVLFEPSARDGSTVAATVIRVHF
ncbi:MAG: Gmad2 immunoglobulin-like domain-containing protein [Acidimicrobiales bacterium]